MQNTSGSPQHPTTAQQTIATIVGRGHGGTRAGASWLRSAGFDIGRTNQSLDRLPFDQVYEAGEIALRQTRHLGGEKWDLESLNTCPIPRRWRQLWDERLHLLGTGERVAWKVPETVFSYPWLAREYPEVRFIIWHRDPRDSIHRSHPTDDMSRWGLAGWPKLPILHERALSWVVQYHLLEGAIQPPHHCRVRLRDFVLEQEAVGAVVADTLGLAYMPGHPVVKRAIGRHTDAPPPSSVMDRLAPYLKRFTAPFPAWQAK